MDIIGYSRHGQSPLVPDVGVEVDHVGFLRKRFHTCHHEHLFGPVIHDPFLTSRSPSRNTGRVHIGVVYGTAVTAGFEHTATEKSVFIGIGLVEVLDDSGIQGLEVCDADQKEKAVRLFFRDGFVCVRDALSTAQLNFLRSGCNRVVNEMLALDGERVGNRGSHRYSFGGASRTGAQLHHPEWAMLVDIPVVTEIVSAIFGSADFIVRSGGGDFCLFVCLSVRVSVRPSVPPLRY